MKLYERIFVLEIVLYDWQDTMNVIRSFSLSNYIYLLIMVGYSTANPDLFAHNQSYRL